jgi:hypothetical protein
VSCKRIIHELINMKMIVNYSKGMNIAMRLYEECELRKVVR